MTNVTMLVRNRPRLTRQAIGSLMWTTDYLTDVALTILDDRSDAETARVLPRRFVFRNDVPMGTGELRNLVIRESEQRHGRGNYLYLSDNDVLYRPGWLTMLTALYEIVREEFAVLGGVNHPFHQPVAQTTPLDAAGYRVDEVLALATQSMLMSWEVYDRFGPFCQTPVDRVCQSEDVDFCNRIRAAGMRVGVVSPALIVATGITNTFGEPIPGAEAVRALCPAGVICE